jgi:hypothetical protein
MLRFGCDGETHTRDKCLFHGPYTSLVAIYFIPATNQIRQSDFSFVSSALPPTTGIQIMEPKPSWIEHPHNLYYGGVDQKGRRVNTDNDAGGPPYIVFAPTSNMVTPSYNNGNTQFSQCPIDEAAVMTYRPQGNQPTMMNHKEFHRENSSTDVTNSTSLTVVSDGQQEQQSLGNGRQYLGTVVSDDGETCETVDDFKSQLDRDREKWAQATALRLLRSTGFRNGNGA